MKLIRLFLIFFALNSFFIDAKILLFTYSYNRPDFIEMQYKTFKKFLLDDYEFIVFNDATEKTMFNQINQVCEKYNIKCISIPQEIHTSQFYNASVRNCAVVNYSLKTVGFNHDDIIGLFDSDLFLIKEFSIREYLKGFNLAGQDQARADIHYLWIGLVFLNMATMPNKNTIDFGCGFVGNTNTDSGGFTYHYLHNNPEASVRYFENQRYLTDFTCAECKNKCQTCVHTFDLMKEYQFSDALIDLSQKSSKSNSEIYLGNCFLHYRAGSNWNYESHEFHEQKTKQLREFFARLGIDLD